MPVSHSPLVFSSYLKEVFHHTQFFSWIVHLLSRLVWDKRYNGNVAGFAIA